MTTLYVAWQDQQSRSWFPVGRLSRRNVEPEEYEFEYIQGAEDARNLTSPFVIPFPGFPEMDKTYRSTEIFPMFRYRAMNQRRPDRSEYLSQLGIDVEEWDVVAELAVSGGHSQADSIELFPAVEPDAEGRFNTRFILHGLNFTNEDSVRRVRSLKIGERLELSFELSNPATVHAITVKTTDQYIIGWLPRYLVDVMHQDNAWKIEDVEAKVAQVNSNASLSHHLLVEFGGRLPEGINPMSYLAQYKPIQVNSNGF